MYIYAIDPQAMFDNRTHQGRTDLSAPSRHREVMRGWGLGKVVDMTCRIPLLKDEGGDGFRCRRWNSQPGVLTIH